MLLEFAKKTIPEQSNGCMWEQETEVPSSATESRMQIKWQEVIGWMVCESWLNCHTTLSFYQ